MIKCSKISVVICFCSVSSILLLCWNTNKQDLYVRVLKTEPELKDEVYVPKDDEKLYDLDFKYIINSKTCQQGNSTNYLAVIIVTSYAGDVEARSAMRRAFNDDDLKQLKLRRVFLLASAPDDAYVTQNAVYNEHERFGDIVQGNFIEAYRNLTYKHTMGIRWVTRFCNNVKYVIKMDDDVVLDMYRIIELIKTIKLPSKNYIGGYILKGMAPIRDPANKWYTTLEEYRPARYPTFVSGWFYITTPSLCLGIAALSKRVPYFWIDDVYVTGILAQKLKVRYLNLNRYFAVHAEFMQCCLRDLPTVQCDFLIGPNGGDSNMFYDFNAVAADCFLGVCARRTKPVNTTCVAEKKINLGKGNAIIKPYILK